MEIMAFLQQALVFLLVLFVRYLRRFLLFSMVLNSGRLSGAFFRLFKPFFHENGGTINTQGNCVLFLGYRYCAAASFVARNYCSFISISVSHFCVW